MTLTLKRDGYANEVYRVYADGQYVGSIVRQTGGFEAGGYFWSVITPGPQDSSFRGMASDLEEAKAEFKAAWLRLQETRG